MIAEPRCYPPAVINRAIDPRTADRIVYDLLRTDTASRDPAVIGEAVFDRGDASVDAEENVAVAVRELLERPFVDRVQADERPRGYRRTGRGQVDLLVPGMAEHFIARMRGLWLSFPDGSVVTARERAPLTAVPGPFLVIPEAPESAPAVVDPAVRRATLATTGEGPGGPPLVRGHAPLGASRLEDELPQPHRTDCGWLV